MENYYTEKLIEELRIITSQLNKTLISKANGNLKHHKTLTNNSKSNLKNIRIKYEHHNFN